MTDTPPARSGPAPPSVRAIDGACIVLALWTLCCHVAVLAGGSLLQVLGFFGVAVLGLAAAVLWRRRRVAPEPPVAPPTAAAPSSARTWLLPALASLLAVAGLALAGDNLVAAWWLLLGLLAVACALFVLAEPLHLEPPAAGRGLEAGLWGLGLGCAAVTLLAHRVDIDDAFYVNLAVAAADAPAARLLAGDTLHGLESLPIHLPVYRLHSWEIWNGAWAALAGIPAIACFHLLWGPLAALAAPLALARLLRWLTPRSWLWTTAAVLFVLLAVGGVHRWYGNFAFVRMWQGKSVFLWVLLPLIQAYAIELVLRPRRGTWLRLAAAQIAALGCTSTAAWAAPAAALAAAACALAPRPRSLARLGLVALASCYVLGAGWVLKDAVERDRATRVSAQERSETEQARIEGRRQRLHAPGAQLRTSFELVTGEGRLRALALFALAAAWAFCPPGLARRFAIVVPLAVWVVLLDPYTTRFISANVVGPSSWRALWLLPVPLLLALLLTFPLRVSGRRRWAGALVAGFACVAFALLVPQASGLTAGNGVTLGWPRLKVRSEPHRWAGLLTERAGPGAVAVAPGPISVWLPTFHDRVHPLVVRPLYLARYRQQLGDDDLNLRLLMANYVAGEAENAGAAQLFELGLEHFEVDAVCLRAFSDVARARSILRRAGFRPDLRTLDYEIWLRS